MGPLSRTSCSPMPSSGVGLSNGAEQGEVICLKGKALFLSPSASAQPLPHTWTPSARPQYSQSRPQALHGIKPSFLTHCRAAWTGGNGNHCG